MVEIIHQCPALFQLSQEAWQVVLLQRQPHPVLHRREAVVGFGAAEAEAGVAGIEKQADGCLAIYSH